MALSAGFYAVPQPLSVRRDSLPSSTGRRGGDSDPQTTAFPARRPSVCYTARWPLLIWSAGHGSFFSACRPSVCYPARWPTFDYGPTTTLSTGTHVVRLLYCPPALAYDLVRRPHLFPAGLPAVCLPYTASWPLP